MNKNKQIKYKLEMILYIIQLKFGFFMVLSNLNYFY